MGYGEIYKTTWGVLPVQFVWGVIYFDLSVTSAVPNLVTTLQGRATSYENAVGTTTILNAL